MSYFCVYAYSSVCLMRELGELAHVIKESQESGPQLAVWKLEDQESWYWGSVQV